MAYAQWSIRVKWKLVCHFNRTSEKWQTSPTFLTNNLRFFLHHTLFLQPPCAECSCWRSLSFGFVTWDDTNAPCADCDYAFSVTSDSGNGTNTETRLSFVNAQRLVLINKCLFQDTRLSPNPGQCTALQLYMLPIQQSSSICYHAMV